jgi:hypothetical protein
MQRTTYPSLRLLSVAADRGRYASEEPIELELVAIKQSGELAKPVPAMPPLAAAELKIASFADRDSAFGVSFELYHQ